LPKTGGKSKRSPLSIALHKEASALRRIVEALQPFEKAERDRLVKTALEFLGREGGHGKL